MHHATNDSCSLPLTNNDVLTDLLRQGAQKMLAEAINAEVADWIAARRSCRDDQGHQQVVRNGYPAEHWLHIRSTNVIESVFATVRLRTAKTKGSGNREACLTMVFKLMESAAKRWRALNGTALLTDVIAGIAFVDGEKQEAAA